MDQQRKTNTQMMNAYYSELDDVFITTDDHLDYIFRWYNQNKKRGLKKHITEAIKAINKAKSKALDQYKELLKQPDDNVILTKFNNSHTEFIDLVNEFNGLFKDYEPYIEPEDMSNINV